MNLWIYGANYAIGFMDKKPEVPTHCWIKLKTAIDNLQLEQLSKKLDMG